MPEKAPRRLPRLFAIAALLGCGVGVRAEAADHEIIEFFEKRVRPVFATHCADCHGAKKQEAGLRLDTREGFSKGSDGGPIFDAGEPGKSKLLDVLTHEGDVQMPPDGPLSAEDRAAIERWVLAGAVWPERGPDPAAALSDPRSHWAFQPVRPAPLPAVKHADWVKTPVDAFLLAAMEAKGVSPSPAADRRTLIRRLSFALIGLPPSVEEIDSFLADPSPDALERVVDRLLASPHYGERWGRHWLDVARYGDAKAYVFTEDRNYRHAFTYRDYVIDAFNADKPYDQFLVEQIAADRLPEGDPRRLAAMGFLTLGRRYLNDYEEIIDDRIDVVTRGLMGLTVTCARCHDHKYDPIPIDDYYSLYGVFASSTEPGELPILPRRRPTADQADFERLTQSLDDEIARLLRERRDAMIADLRGRLPFFLLAGHDLGFDPKHAKLDEVAGGRKVSPALLRRFLERWPAYLEETRKSPDVVFALLRATAGMNDEEVAAAAPALSRQKFTPPAIAEALSKKPVKSRRDLLERYGELLAEAGRRFPSEGRIALYPTAGASAPSPACDPGWLPIFRAYEPAESILFSIADSEVDGLLDKASKEKLDRLRGRLAEVRRTHPGQPPRAMVMLDAQTPQDTHVFLRGNRDRKGKLAPRQFPAILSPPDRKPFTQGSGRLELARAVVDPANPLTARVMVNRVWMHHFGTGLVRTPGDFGMRGEPPTHPGLLDALAADFVAHGWSVKRLHRWIVLSSAYAQSSAARPDLDSVDPDNRLYARFPRRRLDFEATRDAILFASGRLERTIGGRSFSISSPPYSGRRTLYAYVDRQNIDNLFRTFDFPNPNFCATQRYQTTTPQQALFLMNSPFMIEQARLAASGAPASSADPSPWIHALYRRFLGRAPDEEELLLGRAFLERGRGTDGGSDGLCWHYGFGEYDPDRKRISVFHHLPHWSGNSWRIEKDFPHPTLGFAELHATGGHVGRDPRHAVVRRWVAPRDMVVLVSGKIEHGDGRGDGVRAWIVSNRHGELGRWIVHNLAAETRTPPLEVRQGDTIDFVVDCRENDGYDSFTWAPMIEEASSSAGYRPDLAMAWDATADFDGPPGKRLTPWEAYAQALLISNEFIFVD